MIRDVLVATGDRDADAYLRIVRTILPMQRALDQSRAALENGQPQQSVLYGDPPSYEEAGFVAAQAEEDMEVTWAAAHEHFKLAAARNRVAADRADAEATLMFEEYFAAHR
ncbi:hypothetical protein ABZ470_26665 [Streptosporangium sp. NPDC020072]|uniref:hypothetical protein n=1 Tax=Streptosporangium sp. NPDC020072 TaxID=3154788 RepID=UPI00343FDC91